VTHVTCRLTAKNRDQLRNPALGNRVWASFTFLETLTEALDVKFSADRAYAVLPGLPQPCDQQTDRQTDHATRVAIDRAHSRDTDRSTGCRVLGGQGRCRSHGPAAAAGVDRVLPAVRPPRGGSQACWTPAGPTATGPPSIPYTRRHRPRQLSLLSSVGTTRCCLWCVSSSCSATISRRVAGMLGPTATGPLSIRYTHKHQWRMRRSVAALWCVSSSCRPTISRVQMRDRHAWTHNDRSSVHSLHTQTPPGPTQPSILSGENPVLPLVCQFLMQCHHLETRDRHA